MGNQLSPRKLPFPDGSLRAIVMTDVMHHIADAECFSAEAQRTLVPGGVPFRYLVSDGVSMRALAPARTFRARKNLGRLLAPLMGQLAAFASIAVERR
jgi:ubiquinone/menaquinone biosynthesis C-methylase UbiE